MDSGLVDSGICPVYGNLELVGLVDCGLWTVDCGLEESMERAKSPKRRMLGVVEAAVSSWYSQKTDESERYIAGVLGGLKDLKSPGSNGLYSTVTPNEVRSTVPPFLAW